MGSLGAALCRQQAGAAAFEAHSIPAEPVDVATTSGAGDCLVAGACMRLLEGRGAVSALAYGMVGVLLCQPMTHPLRHERRPTWSSWREWDSDIFGYSSVPGSNG